MSRAGRVVRGLGALTVLVGVVVGVPVLLVVLGLVPDGLPTVGEVLGTLRARDDGQLLRGVLAAGAWVCWFVFTIATATELWSMAAARPVPSLRGLRVVQGPVAALVAAVVVGLSLSGATAGPLVVASASDRPPLPVAAVATASVSSTAPSAGGAASMAPAQTAGSDQQYVVQRRDTLWALAERHLGDPLRYTEIVALNQDVVGPDNRITPGTTLTFPRDAVGVVPAAETPPAVTTTDVVVQPGDSLWSITEEVTGDGASWPVVWQTNEGRVEPGGEVLADPDLIRAGWTVTVPSVQVAPPPSAVPDDLPAPPTTSPSPTTPSATPAEAPPSPATATAVPDGSRAAEASPTPIEATQTHDVGSTADDGTAAAVVGVGAASALAAGTLLLLGRYRRRQFRHRRPGRLLPLVPAHLTATERMLTSRAGVDLAWLDQALRDVVACSSGSPLPDVVAVGMTGETITVVLSEPVVPVPPSWTTDESGVRWTTRRDTTPVVGPPARVGGHAPFPGLVAIGSRQSGEQWFIDLEQVGVLHLTGDPERATDLLRYLAAELANNPWSEMSLVDAAGIGDELWQLNPDRLVLHDSADPTVARFRRCLRERVAALEAQPVDALRSRVENLHTDAWAPRMLLLGPGHQESAAELEVDLARGGRRVGLAMVVHAGESGVGLHAVIDANGTLSLPELDLTLVAHQLPAHEAAPLAQLLAHAGVVADPVLAGAEGAETSEGTTDTRPLVVDELVDSVLPLPDATYLQAAATTREDLQALAPAATTAERQRAVDADPDLDRDLADWHDPECTRPKLSLLGPVHVQARGRLPERNPRRQFYTEVVAYLATRPDGATSEQYATALWPDEPDVVGKTKVRQSISVVRTWLGADESGSDHLPSGLTAAAGGRYRITRAVVDADLFRRLRTRGVARGADGMSDLELALGLVRGRPFELPDLRVRGVGGYSWLLDDGARMDLELSAAIVDVAHLVATHHLGNSDPARAAAAAHVALRSGTYEDVPLLDLVAACDAVGNRAEADAYVARILVNHDAEVEEDLPPRTAAVLFRRERR